MEPAIARIVRASEGLVSVFCPYCGAIHHHGEAKMGDYRGSHCDKPGVLRRDYQIGEPIPCQEIAVALRLHERDLKRKRVARKNSSGTE